MSRLPNAAEQPALFVGGDSCPTSPHSTATAPTAAKNQSNESSSAIAQCLLGCSVGAGDAYCDVSYWLIAIGVPLLLVVGTIGNTLTLIVMATKTMRGTAFGTYIAALAAADTLVLWATLPRHFIRWVWLVDVRELSVWSCRTLRFLQFSLMHTSAWLLVTVTAERFLVVYFPSRFRLHRKRRRALWVVAAVAAFHCTWNAHIFFTLGDNRSAEDAPAAPGSSNGTCSRHCAPAPDDSVTFYWSKVHQWLDMVKLSVLPFVLMLFMNFAIVAALSKGSLSPTQKGPGSGSRGRAADGPGGSRVRNGNIAAARGGKAPPTPQPVRRMDGNGLRVFGAMLFGCGSAKRFRGSKLSASESKTVMLLWVSFFYVLTTAPAFVSTVMENAGRGSAIFSSIATILLYVNNAANFILYSLSGATFRRLFIDTFTHSRCCCCSPESNCTTGFRGAGARAGGVSSALVTEDVDLHAQDDE